jgi:hypothetical protein
LNAIAVLIKDEIGRALGEVVDVPRFGHKLKCFLDNVGTVNIHQGIEETCFADWVINPEDCTR